MSDGPLILYVEDDPAVRLGSTQALQIAGHRVRSVGTAEQAIPHLAPGFRGVVVTDVRLPGKDGLQLLADVQRVDSGIPVILVTGHGDISMAVHAMRQGAYDFIEKPFSSEQLNEVVGRALEKRQLSLEVDALRGRLANFQSIEAKLVGRSNAIVELRRAILNVASTSADVLITGETGTGKELVARCLHDFSKRATGPFAALNCGGMPEALFESEVFGHEAGAFTGAAKQRIGKIEFAAGGSLFLDEIETMPTNLQVKLLRTLQERQFERLGSNALHPMDCRVMAATKTDLLNPPRDHPFRSDLYYRLSVVVLEVPPLRERREDIPILLSHFMLQAALRYEREVPEIEGSTMTDLLSRPWQGNVRELRNMADRLVLGIPTQATSGARSMSHARLDEQLHQFELYLIKDALAVSAGRAAAASERLGIPKKTLYDKMKRFGLSPQDYRAE
ncbi:sigma-54 dependent transcriptional regulator [Curvibacter sp. HBC28]|uniref:Sigma-54 dependent transcriptional regulator n=1 Tax=Curvibacter microcysteis TaxID=3026419 RepID=A0ABT5MH24_9BURK|nr:sigma-54 dependent transcriptional regulator [Curvibacter sp. HBC28]MDD0815883.1 sigma-54 dependent transcriptional regulator [Curvibacter sp. HBC28]